MDEDKFTEFKSEVRIRNLNRIVAACDNEYPDTKDWLKTDGEKIVFMALQHVSSIENRKKVSNSLKEFCNRPIA